MFKLYGDSGLLFLIKGRLLLSVPFLEFADIFQEPLLWQSALVGISVRALWLWRVTGARGVTCLPCWYQSPSPVYPSQLQHAGQHSFLVISNRERREGTQCRLLSLVSIVSQWSDGQAWEQNVVRCTYRSFLAINGSPQNNGNYQNYCNQNFRTQIRENCFKRIADHSWWMILALRIQCEEDIFCKWVQMNTRSAIFTKHVPFPLSTSLAHTAAYKAATKVTSSIKAATKVT